MLGHRKEFFAVEGYRVSVERHGGEIWSEATVRVKVGGESIHTVAESSGPVGALDKALRLGLEKIYPQLRDMKLRDYKVRIVEGNEGTGSKTRVLVESGDGHSVWGTVGGSDNIIDASWEALREAGGHRPRSRGPPPWGGGGGSGQGPPATLGRKGRRGGGGGGDESRYSTASR